MNTHPTSGPTAGPEPGPAVGPPGPSDPQATDLPPTGPPPTIHAPGPDQPPPHEGAYTHGGPRIDSDQLKDLRRLRREPQNGRIAGVAAGLARYLDIDPLLVRVALVVLIFFGGAGVILYAAGWILLPIDDHERPLGLDDRNRSLALIAAGVVAAVCLIGDLAGDFWFPWPLALVAVAVVVILNLTGRNRQTEAYVPASGPAYQAGGAEPYAPGSPGSPVSQAPLPLRPRDPRRRGPVLFWWTLPLIALAMGTLGVVDLAGADLPAAAYPALGLAITALALLLSAWWGRGGGLILIGLVLAAALPMAAIADHTDASSRHHAPTSASQVASHYELGLGDLTIDLSRVSDSQALAGRSITVDGDIGDIRIIIPAGVDASAKATADVGEVTVLGATSNGIDPRLDSASTRPVDTDEALTIDARINVGSITIEQVADSTTPFHHSGGQR